MRIFKLYRMSIIVVLAVIGSAAIAQVASFGPSEKIVTGKLSVSTAKLTPGSSFKLTFRGTVGKGYHIGAHHKDALYPANLTVKGPKGFKFGTPAYPKARMVALKIGSGGKIPVYEGAFAVTVRGTVPRDAKQGKVTLTATFDSQGCKDDQCFPPQKVTSSVKAQVVGGAAKVALLDKGTSAAGAQSKLGSMGMLHRVIWLYLGGLLLAFTPCVYPMIPVTMGYFSNQGAQNKRRVMVLAGFYVLGIALTYSTLGAIAATTGGVFGTAMQTPPVKVGVAAVLVALALSMFGLYELQAPGFIQSRASGRAGALGALVMGLIFGLVAAPCVGPVVLSLMAYVASVGSVIVGFWLFFALALGIGTPLFVLAMFSAKMPMPGVWMVAVKKFAGFLLIGAAAYFVQPLVPEMIGRLLIPAVVLAAGVYMGCVERSLHHLKLAPVFGKAFCLTALVAAVALATPSPRGAAVKWEAYSPAKVTAAAKSQAPVMIDFTASWCAACKELEHGPFADPAFIRATAGFRTLRVDATDPNSPAVKAAVRKYKVMGFPTIVFIDKSGKEVASARVTGYVKSAELIKRIGSSK